MWWLAGCTWIDDAALAERLAAEDRAAPDIVVTPESLDLGVARVGVTILGDVTVRNTGGAALHVTPSVEGDALAIPTEPFTVAPGETHGFVVTFVSATPGIHGGTVTLTSDDPDTPTVSVPVTAEAEPEPVDLDADDDGHDRLPEGDDCDDADATVFPGAEETWYDGVDQDCDGASDYDQDADTHDRAPEGDDCDDTDAAAFPGADEGAYTGADEDCDGIVDEMGAALAPWTVLGTYADDALGSGGVHLLDDLDGDGFSELVIATPGANTTSGADVGIVGFHTPRAPDVELPRDGGWLTFSGGDPDDFFGAEVAAVGDLDGDGTGEVAIGAWGRDGGAVDEGAVYIVDADERRGDGEGPSYAISVLSGTVTNGWVGYAVAAGDFDGDGISDVATGAPGASGGRGEVYVSFVGDGLGDADFDAQASAFSLSGVSVGDHLGAALVFGDLDADGFDDLVACSPDDDDGGTDAGTCWIYLGNARRDGLGVSGLVVSSGDDAVIIGVGPGAQLGVTSRTLAVGDLDDDGAVDLAVGSPGPDDAGGTTWIFANGTLAGAAAATSIVSGTGGLGTAVAIGDLTRDGVADLVVGAPAGDAGVVYLLAGGALPSSLPLAGQVASWSGEALGDAFGTALGVRDLDGDGRTELVVSATGQDTSASAAGKVYVLPGY